MMKKLFVVSLILFLLLLPCCSAADDEEFQEFYPSGFIFEYNDHNSTVYEGDSGLKVGYVNNSLDGNLYVVATENIRGFAYATKGTFKFNESILVKVTDFTGLNGYHTVTHMKFKNGTVIPYLGLEQDDLTNEQKKYFDNYESQRAEYLMQEQEYAADANYRYQTHMNRHKSKYSYYVGSGGSGIIYTPSSDYYW